MRVDQLMDKIEAQELEIEQLRSELEYKQKVLEQYFFSSHYIAHITFNVLYLI